MNRLDEINSKHAQLCGLLETLKAPALWLQRTRNIAWFSAGMDASIPVDSETGMYSILVTERQRTIYSSNIELTRLRGEELVESLGFDVVEFPWHAARMPGTAGLITDLDESVEARIQALRWTLSAPEQDRYRALGADTAAALEEAAGAVRPGDTEFAIAARLDAACRRRGMLALVNLVGVDDRIRRYRHPLATHTPVEKYAMLIVCARREGLIAAATRLVHFGPLPDELETKQRRVAAVDAAAIAASRPGQTLGSVFASIQQAYANQNEEGQWQNHHQGGLIGYIARERVATPGDTTVLRPGHACAWNPSIVGCKSEDTILLGEGGFEITTQASPDWPVLEVDVAGQKILRPAILPL